MRLVSRFGNIRDAHPDERFYAFALYTDDEGSGANPSTCTEQSLQRTIAGPDVTRVFLSPQRILLHESVT